jgi:hypothetical protein
MTISEPATLLTDYALSMLSFGLAFSLRRRSSEAGGRKVGLWIAGFGVTALAALAGGSAHGFRIPLGDSWAYLWRFTVVSIAAGSVLLIAAGARSSLRSESLSASERSEGISWLERAIAVTLIALAVLVLKLAPHRHFNHNDLYHAIQMAGLIFLYRAAIRLHGLSGSGTRPETGS